MFFLEVRLTFIRVGGLFRFSCGFSSFGLRTEDLRPPNSSSGLVYTGNSCGSSRLRYYHIQVWFDYI
jgi:hypothetical protein